MSRHIVIGPALALVSDPFRHALESTGGAQMPYEVKPLACDPTAINGMSGQPILALDMYEHSYHIDYGAQAAAYVDAFMAAINWPSVAAAHVRLRPVG